MPAGGKVPMGGCITKQLPLLSCGAGGAATEVCTKAPLPLLNPEYCGTGGPTVAVCTKAPLPLAIRYCGEATVTTLPCVIEALP